jgi:ubiquinone/menaquinone biosynthesis C-methylase UbiE
MKSQYANYLINKTKQDYNSIAHDFSSKRAYLSNDILALKKYFTPGDKVLDLGCGNGRLYDLFENQADYIGVDGSEELLKTAQMLHPKAKFQVVDFFHLPIADNSFDKIYCLSVLHHIPSEDYRAKVIKEISRVLKPEGQSILTVWDLYSRPEIKRQIFKNLALKIVGRSKLDFKDIFYRFKKDSGEVIDRYIHCFTLLELTNLIKKRLKIQEQGILKRNKGKFQNLYIVAKKC